MKKNMLLPLLTLLMVSCVEKAQTKGMDAQQIVDEAITVSGGERYRDHNTTFYFRNREYRSMNKNGKKVLQRITFTDSMNIKDVRTHQGLKRYFNDSLISLADSVAERYANSVNSVHYFARLPFGLNDPAVKKERMADVLVKGKSYYKIKVTFAQEDGGKDFDDTYIYWFDQETFKPDYLAYEFHVDGGGIRFREAFNERYFEGIRFVDYNNLKPKTKGIVLDSIDRLFETGQLELLSKIELDSIQVDRSN
ncbi:DUF6503 family protein [Flagellimonas sp. DF-77]|uniref:DUF6503 family protein n=1 Tax=Flagellimonas algarum TaxID=3230298 RepID=UPI0033941CB4